MMKKFSLLELMIVLAIIGILLSMLLPLLNKAKKTAQLAVSAGNMKQISTSIFNHSVDNDRRFLRARQADNYNITYDDILHPYLGGNLSSSDLNSGVPPYDPIFKLFSCPMDLMEKPASHYTRTYSLNSMGFNNLAFNWPKIFAVNSDDNKSMKPTRITHPADTIMMVEQSKEINYVGHNANAAISNGNLYEVTDNRNGSSFVDPNHHKNGFKNPISFIDGHVAITNMINTLHYNGRNYLWKSRK